MNYEDGYKDLDEYFDPIPGDDENPPERDDGVLYIFPIDDD